MERDRFGREGLENLRVALSHLGLVWPEERTEYSMSCRVYHAPQGLKGLPAAEVLEERLRLV
jgi:hypothetical protein